MEEGLVRAVLENAVASGAVAGVVAAVTTADGTILEVAAGRQSVDGPEPMAVDSKRRMGERSATHRFFPPCNKSMGYASLTHPTQCQLSGSPGPKINDRLERIAAGQLAWREQMLATPAATCYAHICAWRQSMGQDAGLRQACNLSLPPDLVQQARRHTDNLSGTVEALLAAWVAREESSADEEAERTKRLLAGLNQLRSKIGSLADDFSPL